MVLHALWTAPFVIPVLSGWTKYIIIGVVGWSVLLYLVRLGLKQIADEKRMAMAQAVAEDSAEAAMAEVLVFQQTIAERLVTPFAPASPEAPKPRREADHLELDDKVEASDERERDRQRPEFANRPWARYYGNGGDSASVSSQQQGAASKTSNQVTSAAGEQPQGKGTPSKDAWRKYYGN